MPKIILFSFFLFAALLLAAVIAYRAIAGTREEASFRKQKKKLEQQVQHAIYSTDTTTTPKSRDELLVYQVSAHSNKFLPPQSLPLPDEGDSYVSIIPVGGQPLKGSQDWLTLRREGRKVGQVSHDAPLLVYRSAQDDRCYLKVNAENTNATTFAGRRVEDELLLEEALTTDRSHAKLFSLCGSPMAFMLLSYAAQSEVELPSSLNAENIEPAEKTEKNIFTRMFRDENTAKAAKRPAFKH